jgi:hypothetical protein
MSRSTSTLALLGAAAALVTWMVPPASSAPSPSPLPAFVEVPRPELIEMNRQVDRLRARVEASPRQAPEPTRDPFNFGRRPEPPRPAMPRVAMPDPPPAPVLPPLPRLVAVIRESPESDTRSAVLSNGDDVAFVAPGDRYAGYVISAVTETGLVLTEPNSGQSVRLSLQ